jgi:hypothetical protein
VLQRNYASVSLLPLMQGMYALPASLLFTPSVVKCAKMQVFRITQPLFHVALDTNGLLKALTTSSFMLVALQLPK